MVKLFRPNSRPRSNSEAVAHTKKGFNLIEAAIVLGVVELVIGGIWVAASAVREKMGVNNITKETMELYYNVLKIYPRPIPDDYWQSADPITESMVPKTWEKYLTWGYREPSLGYRFEFYSADSNARIEIYIYPPANGQKISKSVCVNLANSLALALDKIPTYGHFIVDAPNPTPDYEYTFGAGDYSLTSVADACVNGANQFIIYKGFYSMH